MINVEIGLTNLAQSLNRSQAFYFFVKNWSYQYLVNNLAFIISYFKFFCHMVLKSCLKQAKKYYSGRKKR